MAEGRTSSTSSPCWFYANNGTCRQGANCPYSHIAPEGPLACRYYQQGRCMFGRSCRNLHSGSASRLSESSDDSDGFVAASRARSGAAFHSNTKSTCPRGSTSSLAGAAAASSSNSSSDMWGSSSSTGGRRKGRGSVRVPLQDLSSASTTSNSSANVLKGNSLKKQANSSDSGLGEENASLPLPPSEWVQVPEFVPTCSCNDTNKVFEARGPKSYAEVVNPSARSCPIERSEESLCPYAEAGECKYEDCSFLHGLECELCGKACLHPFDEDQRKKHNSECVKQHEKDMELSFAIARSKDKMCGVCFEVVMEKNPREQRFGILPNCNHCFCLSCIRTWRQAKQFENNITRACPECRVGSDFVCPSMYWVDTKEDKDKLITDYKGALSTKDCKYFKKGEGKCPFGNKCFYLHVLPDGSRVDVGPPSRQRRHNAEGELDVLQHIILWDFLEERDAHILYLDEIDLDDSFFTDSDFSDSDMEFMF